MSVGYGVCSCPVHKWERTLVCCVSHVSSLELWGREGELTREMRAAGVVERSAGG